MGYFEATGATIEVKNKDEYTTLDEPRFIKGAWVNNEQLKKETSEISKYRSIILNTGFSNYYISESPYIEGKEGMLIQKDFFDTYVVVPLPGFQKGRFFDYFDIMKKRFEATIIEVMEDGKKKGEESNHYNNISYSGKLSCDVSNFTENLNVWSENAGGKEISPVNEISCFLEMMNKSMSENPINNSRNPLHPKLSITETIIDRSDPPDARPYSLCPVCDEFLPGWPRNLNNFK